MIRVGPLGVSVRAVGALHHVEKPRLAVPPSELGPGKLDHVGSIAAAVPSTTVCGGLSSGSEGAPQDGHVATAPRGHSVPPAHERC